MISKRLIAFSASLVFLVVAGCGGKGTASGKVEYDGRPIGKGYITFLPATGDGPTSGGPIADGQYRVDDLTPGKKLVQIVGVKKVNFPTSNDELARQWKAKAQHGDSTGTIGRAEEVPTDAPGNNSEVEVKEGEQLLDFAVKRKTGR
jgi:hypothetical protein